MTNAEAITKLQSMRKLRGAREAVELAIQALQKEEKALGAGAAVIALAGSIDAPREVRKVLCSQCFDASGAVMVRGCFPQSICESCGRECMGYGADVLIGTEDAASTGTSGSLRSKRMNSWRVLPGDARTMLAQLEPDSVQMCVTSPPYWGAQRDYGHSQQLGMERTPELFVSTLVEVFRDVRRVLRKDGTLWLNIGDSYAASGKGGGGKLMSKRKLSWGHRDRMRGWRGAPVGYKAKDIVGVPWLLATALRADGWYLRRDIVWAKLVPTEPTRLDRPVSQHEMVFLLSKSPRYAYSLPASQEGTVWSIASGNSDEHHSATMPIELAERCISRGSKPGDTVLDPFTGRGTSGIAAISLDRSFVGIEIDARSVALARRNIGNVAPLLAREVA